RRDERGHPERAAVRAHGGGGAAARRADAAARRAAGPARAARAAAGAPARAARAPGAAPAAGATGRRGRGTVRRLSAPTGPAGVAQARRELRGVLREGAPRRRRARTAAPPRERRATE